MPTSPRAVLLSYATEDAEAAQRIAEALRDAGVEVWFDKSELRGGDAWDRQIRQQIRDCALFVPIISEHSQARPEGYFRLEWHLAEERKHPMGKNRPFLVPVCLDGLPEKEADLAALAIATVSLAQPTTSQTPAEPPTSSTPQEQTAPSADRSPHMSETDKLILLGDCIRQAQAANPSVPQKDIKAYCDERVKSYSFPRNWPGYSASTENTNGLLHLAGDKDAIAEIGNRLDGKPWQTIDANIDAGGGLLAVLAGISKSDDPSVA